MDRHDRMDNEGGGFTAPLFVDRPAETSLERGTSLRRESFWTRLSRAFVMARIRQAEFEVASYAERNEELLAAQRIFLGSRI